MDVDTDFVQKSRGEFARHEDYDEGEEVDEEVCEVNYEITAFFG